MGLGKAAVAAALERNMAAADRAAAVSPYLAAKLTEQVAAAPPTHVLPNGCQAQDSAPQPAGGSLPGVAGLIGQLNERLDQQVLDAVRTSGTSLLVIGPRTERDPATSQWLDSFLAAPNVSWLGPLASSELPAHLATMSVGLTPYADTAFNRASFPLKTLEYLAAGLPVVSTELPANRWLDTELIDVCPDADRFGARVRELAARPADMEEQRRRREFAAQHSWSARARQMLALMDTQTP
jgi:teichuronic acid biosynthesis glycosyltransferase TuaH